MDHSWAGAKSRAVQSVQTAAKIKCKFHSGGMEEFASNVQNIREDIKTERRV